MPSRPTILPSLAGKRLQNKFWKLLWALVAALTAFLVGYCDRMVAPITWPDEGEPAALYSTQIGDDLRRLYSEAIDNAKQSIFLCTYTFSDKQIAAKLRRQQERGVAVTVVCDKEASPHIRKLLGPNIKLILRHEQGLMHLKIALIDAERILIGSANLTVEALTTQGNLVAVMHSRGLATYLADVLQQQLIQNNTQNSVRQATFSIGGQTLEMWMLPDNSRARERLLQLMSSAESALRVAMFTFTRQDLAQALGRAKKRGIAVRVTLDRHQTLGANKFLALFLERLGIPVSVNRNNPLFHHKLMLVDQEALVCGSANWTKAAFAQNDDCFFVLYPLTGLQQTRLNALGQAIDADSEDLDVLYEQEAA